MVYTDIFTLAFTLFQFTFITVHGSQSGNSNKEQHENVTFKDEVKPIECGKKQSLNEWVNNLPIIKKQDEDVLNKINNVFLQRPKNLSISNYIELDNFQHLLAIPMQSICNVGKWFSLTKWLWRCGATDGERYICMDNFYSDIQNNTCLIYSFGIGVDYGFEEEMTRLGCFVHAYDPTDEMPKLKNVKFHKIGLANFTGEMKLFNNYNASWTNTLPVTTLKDAISSNGDLKKSITYLKVDIESAEINALSEWIESGVLDNIGQIGIELHTGSRFFDEKEIVHVVKTLMSSMSSLQELGFRLVSYSPNKCVGKILSSMEVYHSHVDIVLVRSYM